METGRKILNLRKDLGVPQKSLATQTSVTPSALSRIEAGHHQPRGPVALRLARELGVTVDYLLDRDAPYPPPGREVLENISGEDGGEERNERIAVSARERALLEAVRRISPEQRVLLDATLDAERENTRFTAFVLGAGDDLPGIDDAERARFQARLRMQQSAADDPAVTEAEA